MEDKIMNITKEEGTVVAILKNGDKIPVKAITTYTHWESGRKDCNINIIEPINGSAKQQN